MRWLAVGIVAAGLVVCAGCGDRPLVLQGVVVSVDDAADTVVVRDEVSPNAEVSFSLAGADIGFRPAPGDKVRLAYRDTAGTLVALRLMNLTRQADLAKGGGH